MEARYFTARGHALSSIVFTTSCHGAVEFFFFLVKLVSGTAPDTPKVPEVLLSKVHLLHIRAYTAFFWESSRILFSLVSPGMYGSNMLRFCPRKNPVHRIFDDS